MTNIDHNVYGSLSLSLSLNSMLSNCNPDPDPRSVYHGVSCCICKPLLIKDVDGVLSKYRLSILAVIMGIQVGVIYI